MYIYEIYIYLTLNKVVKLAVGGSVLSTGPTPSSFKRNSAYEKVKLSCWHFMWFIRGSNDPMKNISQNNSKELTNCTPLIESSVNRVREKIEFSSRDSVLLQT